MTKYEEARIIRRAVKQTQKKEKQKSGLIYRGIPHNSDLPKYITDNPFYP